MIRSRSPEGARVLTESEIQDRLYGAYLGRRRPSPGSSEGWTGAEILAGELDRLRAELVSLRREKERLTGELQHLSGQAAGPAESSGGLGWIRRWAAVGAAVCILGYWGARRLQASPLPSAEPTPYTVQVAVYDVRPRAEQAMEFLRRLDYPAFLVEMPRSDGSIHYRIYVGTFVTKEEATLEKIRLAGDPRFRDFKDAFVRIR